MFNNLKKRDYDLLSNFSNDITVGDYDQSVQH